MANENNFGKGMLIGFLTGGAIGAALALLYAPKSGRELRQDIKLKSDEYLDDAEKYIAEAKDRAIDLPSEVLPVPGGPTKHKIGAYPSFFRLRTEIKSKILSFIFSRV